MDAIMKTLKIDEASTRTNFDMSLLEWVMLRSRAAEKTFVSKISSDRYPVAFMGKSKSLYRLSTQN